MVSSFVKKFETSVGAATKVCYSLPLRDNLSCGEKEPCSILHELTKTRCGLYETVRSLCQHFLEFGWMEKGIWYLAQTVAPSWARPRNDRMDLYQIQLWAHWKTSTNSRLTTTRSCKSPIWRICIFLPLFKLFILLLFGKLRSYKAFTTQLPRRLLLASTIIKKKIVI